MMRFNLFGIRFEIAYFSIASVMVFLIISRNNIILLSILSSVLHELGHIFAINHLTTGVSKISILPYEVKIKCDTSGVTLKQEYIINISGVIVNFTLAICSILLYSFVQSSFIFDVFVCSLLIGIFNLLPIKELDGGRLLLIYFQSKNVINIDKVMTVLSAVFIVPLAMAGFYVLLASEFNYSLLFVAIYLLMIIIYKEMR